MTNKNGNVILKIRVTPPLLNARALQMYMITCLQDMYGLCCPFSAEVVSCEEIGYVGDNNYSSATLRICNRKDLESIRAALTLPPQETHSSEGRTIDVISICEELPQIAKK